MPRAVTPPAIERDGPVRRSAITGYTMALGWSPEFCHAARRPGRQRALQCSGRAGRFGLVVHGLWPESERGWPQWCPTRKRPTGTEVARQLCLSPAASLVARQWAKHGACMTKRPATYFKVIRILWNSYRLPDLDRLSRQEDLRAGDVRQAFAAANPGWDTGMVGIEANARGWLEELRLCYDRHFHPARCDRRRTGAPDDAKIRIWRGL